MTPPLDEPALEEDLRSRSFARPGEASVSDPGALRVGLEIEAIPIDRALGRVARLEGAGPRALGRVLRSVAESRGWERVRGRGPWKFRTPEGETVSLEPGAQVEWASRPERRLSVLLERARSSLGAIEAAARDVGIELVYRGMDPVTPEGAAPLQVRGVRYARMDRHFARIGPWGRRMMRGSAAVHVNLDWSADGPLQWRVANRAAPVLTAVFANSRLHAGRDTGHRSFRSAQWRRLDPARCGVRGGGEGDPVREYLRFALEAPAFLLGTDGEPARPFREYLGRPGVGMRQWWDHLSTLFPEVRPRGYLEVRSLDTLSPDHLEAPAVLLAGLLYDRRALEAAADLLPAPGEPALERAGRLGLGDPVLREQSTRLVELALAGAERQAPLVDPSSLEAARRFFAAFTFRGSDPGEMEPGEPEGRAGGVVAASDW